MKRAGRRRVVALAMCLVFGTLTTVGVAWASGYLLGRLPEQYYMQPLQWPAGAPDSLGEVSRVQGKYTDLTTTEMFGHEEVFDNPVVPGDPTTVNVSTWVQVSTFGVAWRS